MLVPRPRTHRHRCYGVLAPNSPLRAAVTALAEVRDAVTLAVSGPAPQAAATTAESEAPSDAVPGLGAGCAGTGVVGVPESQAKPKPRSPGHLLWAASIARICQVFALICGHRAVKEQEEGALREPGWDIVGPASGPLPPKVNAPFGEPANGTEPS